MSVKTQRKSNAAPVSYKVKPAGKTRRSPSKPRSKTNGKYPVSAYEHLHIGIVECSLDGRYINANQEFCRILGYSKKELLKLTVRDSTHEDDYALDLKLHEQLVAGKIPFYGLEKRYVRKDGGLIWAELTRSLVRDAKGKPLSTLGVVIDISEHKQVERVLRESSENLRLAAAAARMFKWELDFQKQLYTFADNFAEVLGFSAGLLPQNSVETVWKLSPAEDVRTISGTIAKAVESHSDLKSLQYRVIDPESGRTTWLEVNAKVIYDAQGNAQRMFGVAQNVTEQKRVEELERTSAANVLAIAEANAKFRAFFDQGSNFAGVMTLDGTLVEANRSSLDFCGFRREEVVGKKFWDCGWWNRLPDLMEMVRRGTQQAAAGKLFRQETSYFLADGTERYVDLIITPVRDETTGQLLFLAPTGTDITERKRMENALRESEERFRALFNQATAGIAQSDREARLIFVNPKLCEMLGYPESELIGKTIWDFTYDRDLEENKQLFERMVASGKAYQFEKRFVCRDGSLLWTSVSVSAVHDAAGNPTGGVGVVVDITPRMQIEEALRTKESELQEIINQTPFMLTRCSRDLRYRFVSSAYARMIGRTPEEIAGKPIGEIMGAEGLQTIAPYVETVLQGEQVEYETEVPFRDVGTPSLHVIYTPDRDEQGNVIGWFASITDVTERKRSERALAEFARQQEALYQLSDRLHHTYSLEEVYNATLGAILSALQCDRASILLFDDQNVMRFVAWHGLSDGYREATEGHSPWGPDEKNPYPICVGEVSASDLSDSLKATVRAEGIVSLAFIPLISNGKLIGKFMVYFDTPHECSDNEIEIGLMIARQLASGIDRKRAEVQLRESEERYRTIVDTANEGVWYIDLNAATVYLNEPMGRILDYTVDEMLGHKVPEFCFEEDQESIQARIVSNYQGNYENFDFRFRRKDGSEVLVLASTSPVRDATGKIIGALGMFVDVTERKRDEERLRESEERLRVTFETAVVGFATLTPDARFVDVNDAFCKIVGYTREELLTMDCAALTHPFYIESTYEHIAQLLEGKIASFVLEKLYLRKDGAEIWVQNSVSVVRRADGTPLHLIAITQDITGRKQAEEQLRASAEFDAFRVTLTDALRPLGDPQKILAEAMRVLGERLQVDRVLYSEIESDDETILIIDNYVKEGVPKLTGRASLNDYGKARASLNAGQNLIIVDATTSPDMDEKDRATFAGLGIRSGLAIPLIKSGRWTATLGIHHAAVRTWTENEIKFVEETAERTWSALEHARAQERLRASEALYRAIARSIPSGGVYIVDKDFRYLVAEGSVNESFGLSREMLEGHTVSEVFPDKRGAITEERLRRSFAGETVRFETKHNGRVYWTQQAPLLDSIGQAIILTLDITERKQAEEALRQSEERFARFMQHLPGLAWIKDIEGRYIYANAAAEKAFGTPREQLYGKTDVDVFPPEVAAQFKKNDEQAVVNEKGMQTVETLQQDDDVWHYSLVTKFPIPGPDGNPAMIGGTAFDITERLQAEQALRESEERYRGLFDLVPIAVYTCDADGLIQEYNHRAVELWGREPKINDPQETKYCGSHKLYYPDGRSMPHAECPMSRALHGETLDRSEVEIVLERPDGSRRHVIAHPLPLRNERGEIVEAINCLYDITEHKRIEEVLRIENERFMRFVNSNIVGILIGDSAGKIILANDYYLRLLGVSRQDFSAGNVDWKKFTPPEWLAADERAIAQLRERGICDPYEKEYVRADGTRVPVYIADAMLPGPGEEIAAFVLDITERRRAEEALRESEGRFSAILQQATAGIVRKDAEGNLIFVNEAYCNMLGYEESELLGKPFRQFTHPEDAVENNRLYNLMMTEGTPFKLEKRVTRRDGSVIWVDASVSPVLDANGKPQSAVAVEVDITGRKQAEEALQQLNLQLESRVQKRTATIQAINQSLREEVAERKRVEEALRMSEAIALASEEKLRTLFDLLPVGISFLDPQGRFLQMNSALPNIVRLTKEQLLDQVYDSRKYIRPDGTPMPLTEFASARALRENKIIYNVETGILLESGELIWTSMSAAPVDVEDVGVVVVTVDITEKKRAEQALQESHGRLRILSQRLVEVQEEERRALARELHDRVGQTLAALNINLIIINSQLSPDAAQQMGARLNDSMKLVAETIALVRDVMTDLRPAVLDDYGLQAALEAHLTSFKSRYNIEVTLDKTDQSVPRLGPSIEMTFLRIAQEALMNIARHAHAEHVNLFLRQEGESICLTVRDDGIGIESWQDANRPGSHGLTIMRERAEAFGGTLKVKSIPGRGTTVEVSIPYPYKKSESQGTSREEQSL